MLISHKGIYDYVNSKSVIVLGSAPCVKNVDERTLNEFDIIVRLNNYKHFNDCRSTDIYYSFFGTSIKKTEAELLADECKYIIHKYPALDFTRHSKQSDGIAVDCLNNNYYRKCKIPTYNTLGSDFIFNYLMTDRIMTTGLSAIMEMIRLGGNVTIAGFDFFESGIHNLDEKWKPGDGNHNMSREKDIVKMFLMYDIIKEIN